MHVLAQLLLFSNAAAPADTGIINFSDATAPILPTYKNALGLTFTNATSYPSDPSSDSVGNPMPSATVCLWNGGNTVTLDVLAAKNYTSVSFYTCNASIFVDITFFDNAGNSALVQTVSTGGNWVWSSQQNYVVGAGFLASLTGPITKITFAPHSVGYEFFVDDLRLWGV